MSGDPRAHFERVLGAALNAVEPGQAVRRALRVQRGRLELAGHVYPLHRYRRALVVGAGKAAAPMAAAVEELLEGAGVRVEGAANVRHGQATATRRVHLHEAGHPIPDSAGVEGTTAIARLLQAADADDLVICVISGGGSALLTLPAEGISLDDLQRTTDALLRCGATIGEINTVRKRLDLVKGGGLARLAAPAPVLALVLSDVVGSPLDAIASGPTVPDSTTWADAAAVLDRYGLWGEVPAPVASRLKAGLRGELPETPKPGDPLFAGVLTAVVADNLLACRAAVAEAERLGLHCQLLTTFVEGEAREVARVLAAFLREVNASGLPLARPCCLVAGGETTVTVRGQGRGGRNQELALAAAWPLQGIPRVLLASIGTDGVDGPTDAAGAHVDGETLQRARDLGLDPARYLRENDAYAFFERVGGLVKTGPTNTNVNDLYLLFAG